jgi:phosphopantothenoylcysteine decarboxylase / phosphopantothenate---cysteine ligase
MSVLKDKKILLAVSGGIAAYKTAHLTRLFIKAGAHVQIVMTPASLDFITPLTLSTLSKNPVYSEFYTDEEKGKIWNNHVELALWADLMIVAPATANTLSKMAHGQCDNLLLATYLSSKCTVYIAPAMDLDMYKHGSTKENLDKLKEFGNKIIPVESGELASGLQGEGRMAEPENIVEFISSDIFLRLPLNGKKILITAGPTYEAIDPVRFIGNHATGLMGFELAKNASKMGADVILVSGPTSLKCNEINVKTIKVKTADEMFTACNEYFEKTNYVICAAAVADYKPKVVAKQKIKKQDSELQIELVKTVDILKHLGTTKKNQIVVGFALETENEIENAKQKIIKKNLDFIILNSMKDKGAGFGVTTNKVTIINHKMEIKPLDLKLKSEVAIDILDYLIEFEKK